MNSSKQQIQQAGKGKGKPAEMPVQSGIQTSVANLVPAPVILDQHDESTDQPEQQSEVQASLIEEAKIRLAKIVPVQLPKVSAMTVLKAVEPADAQYMGKIQELMRTEPGQAPSPENIQKANSLLVNAFSLCQSAKKAVIGGLVTDLSPVRAAVATLTEDDEHEADELRKQLQAVENRISAVNQAAAVYVDQFNADIAAIQNGLALPPELKELGGTFLITQTAGAGVGSASTSSGTGARRGRKASRDFKLTSSTGVVITGRAIAGAYREQRSKAENKTPDKISQANVATCIAWFRSQNWKVEEQVDGNWVTVTN